MSDPKNDKPEDHIVATPEADPEVLGDQELDEANGGWSFTATTTTLVTTTTLNTADTTFTADTIYAGDVDDTLYGGDANMLRIRPGRFGGW